MGDIGAAKLTGGGTTTPKDFQIRLQDCVFATETTMEHHVHRYCVYGGASRHS